MKYIFFGSPEFAAIVFRKLVGSGFTPAAVVCSPDRPVGRKKIITPPPVKVLAEKHGITVLQPEKLENLSPATHDLLHTTYDFFIVAAYAKIIPKEILDIPRLGTIGVHPSLLPKYRGASPIQSAILNGEETTGVTLYMVDEKVDHGPTIAYRETPIVNRDTYETLLKKLAEIGGELLAETLPKFLKGEIKPETQNEAEATLTKKFKTEDGLVEEKKLKEAESGNYELAAAIDRKIRALNPDPGVWTLRQGHSAELSRSPQGRQQRMKLLEAEIKDNKLVLKKIQMEGKRPVTPSVSL